MITLVVVRATNCRRLNNILVDDKVIVDRGKGGKSKVERRQACKYYKDRFATNTEAVSDVGVKMA